MTPLRNQFLCSCRWLFTVFLIFQHLIPSIEAQQQENANTVSTNYRWFCDLTLNPVVTLEWDPTIRGYVVQREEEPDDGLRDPLSGWTRRLWSLFSASIDDEDEVEYDFYPPNLRSSSMLPEFLNPEAALHGTTTTTTRQLRLPETQPTLSQASPIIVDAAQEPVTPAPTVEARACDCWNSMVWGGAFYCTMPRTHCAIPSSPIGLPGCVDVQKQRRIVRSIWPVLVVWYASVLFCLSFTLTGRHAMSCCIATIWPGWNRATADRLLTNDPNQANQMLLRHYRIMRAQYERRLMRRLRRRARRDRRRARRRRAMAEAGVNPLPPPEEDDHSHSSDLEDDDMPFPNLWDLAIIPRPAATSTSEPQPTTLTLKTRIYKQQQDKTDAVNEILLEAKQNAVVDSQTDAKETNDNNNNANEEEDDEVDPESMPVPSSESLATTELDSTSEATMPPEEIENQEGTAEEKEGTDKDEPKESTNDGALTDDANEPDAAVTPIAPDNDLDFSEWDEHACAICYAELEDGDRVGALPCGHVFHVDPCLKHWLTRRNVCPLCLTENVATPNFPHSTAEDHSPAGLSFVVAAPGNMEDSMSDQDRSSSRDDQDDNSILDSNNNSNQNPNIIPAFAAAPTEASRRPRSRLIEMTSIFTRRRRNNATGNNNNGEGGTQEEFSNESVGSPP